ncbi:hypothetical protein HYQ46_004145 [Verticillium longisporum]|nr:hypothetical protein HYQ46_004145 [Verticillium longisporum]
MPYAFIVEGNNVAIVPDHDPTRLVIRIQAGLRKFSFPLHPPCNVICVLLLKILVRHVEDGVANSVLKQLRRRKDGPVAGWSTAGYRKMPEAMSDVETRATWCAVRGGKTVMVKDESRGGVGGDGGCDDDDGDGDGDSGKEEAERAGQIGTGAAGMAGTEASEIPGYASGGVGNWPQVARPPGTGFWMPAAGMNRTIEGGCSKETGEDEARRGERTGFGRAATGLWFLVKQRQLRRKSGWDGKSTSQ